MSTSGRTSSNGVPIARAGGRRASLRQRGRGARPRSNRSNRRCAGRGRTIGDTRLARQFQAISFLDACFVLIQGFPFGVSLGRGQGAFEHVFLWFCFFFAISWDLWRYSGIPWTFIPGRLLCDFVGTSYDSISCDFSCDFVVISYDFV